ncbi:DDE-type integrase/transposase/recombinase [Candidatus Woesearchaeota archaeon]|nr:DDE-type integrase/transposase/recombinase [Candidatus Woesearchaeota archaeon]
MDIRVKSVLLSLEGIKSDIEICDMYEISTRTLRRWKRSYKNSGIEGLKPKSNAPKKQPKTINTKLEQQILKLKQKHLSWGARRIKFQYDLPCHWKTVHNVIKKHSMLVRMKAKPQPCKRFQRKHVDSMWQGDTFQFRIHDVGKVYVTGFTDDCSRYRVKSKTYLHKGAKESVNALQHALKIGRLPREIYLDNGKQFVAKDFKVFTLKHGIKLIYGKPYHPRGRGKIEGYHKVLYRELIFVKTFNSLSHFRKELRKFDKKYNYWRKQEIHGWKTPSSIYNNKKYFNKSAKYIFKRRT